VALLFSGCVSPETRTPSQDDVFALLDAFDPLDTSTLPFVRVATGRWRDQEHEDYSDPPRNRYRFGFLVSDDGGRFTVRCVDLTRETLAKTPEGTPEHERVGYEDLDLASYAREFKARLTAEEEPIESRFYLSPDPTMEPAAEALLLARACERRGGSFWVWPVEHFATEILEEITGIEFYGKREEVQAAWRDWWKIASEKGEEEALAEIVGRGDTASGWAAKRLLERWPDRFDACLRGIRRAEDGWVRQDLIPIVARIRDERVTEFLLEEVEKGPDVGARVKAAEALLDRGRREGLDLFLKEWVQTADVRCAAAGLLLGSGDSDAVRTVGEGFMDQPQPLRMCVLDMIRWMSLEQILERADAASKPDIEKEIERILGLLLDDTHRESGLSTSFMLGDRSVSMHDPLAADLAACQLVRFWPDRYDYDPTVPTRLRMRRLAHVKDVWRARFGLPPIELPAPPADASHRDHVPVNLPPCPPDRAERTLTPPRFGPTMASVWRGSRSTRSPSG